MGACAGAAAGACLTSVQQPVLRCHVRLRKLAANQMSLACRALPVPGIPEEWSHNGGSSVHDALHKTANDQGLERVILKSEAARAYRCHWQEHTGL